MAAGAVAGLAPWSWFAVRELGGLVDFVAIVLPLIVGAAIVVSLLAALRTGRGWPLPLAASSICVGLIAVVGPWTPRTGPAPTTPFTLVTANAAGQRSAVLLDALLGQQPDVLVVTELHEELDAQLSTRYPYRAVTRLVFEARNALVTGTPNNRAGVGVYSNLPFRQLDDPTGLPEGLPGFRLEVEAPGGPVVLYALHLSKASPWSDGFSTTFTDQRTVADRIERAVAQETLPVVIAGDLNMSDRQELYRNFTSDLVDAGRSSWTGPTSAKTDLVWRALLLRIDHVLHTRTLCSARSARFRLPTADHQGVAVEIGPCPSG